MMLNKDTQLVYFDEKLKILEVGTPERKDVVVARNDAGELFLGIRNQYGNAPRFIPMNAIVDLLWGSNGLENRDKLCEKDIKSIEIKIKK